MPHGIFLLLFPDNSKGCDHPSAGEGCAQKNEENTAAKKKKRREKKFSSRQMEPKGTENKVSVASVTYKSVTPYQLPFI